MDRFPTGAAGVRLAAWSADVWMAPNRSARSWTAQVWTNARSRLAPAAKTLRLTTWIATACLAAAFLSQPVSVDAQLALGITVIASMIALWRFGRGLMARWCFLSLGSLIVLRYIFWRATSANVSPSANRR